MATQSLTANIDRAPGKSWDSMRSEAPGGAATRYADFSPRATHTGESRSSTDRVQQAIARSEQDAELIQFFLNWWPFDLLRSLGHWLQCWGCAFAVKFGSDPVSAPKPSNQSPKNR